MGNSSSKKAEKRGPCSPVFERIAYLHVILSYSCGELIDAVRMSHVSSAWRETVVLYGAPIWRLVAEETRNEPGLANCFLAAFHAPELTWAIHQIYEVGGLDANLNFYDSKSALFVAAKCASTFLSSRGNTTAEQRQALHENTKTLLAANADANYVSGRGIADPETSVLGVATKNLCASRSQRAKSDLALIRLLVDGGADFLKPCTSTQLPATVAPLPNRASPLVFAAATGDIEMLQIFLYKLSGQEEDSEEGDDHSNNNNKNTKPLCDVILTLASGAHIDAIQALANQRSSLHFDFSAVDSDNNNALHRVARDVHFGDRVVSDTVDFFAKKCGKDLLLAENADGETPIMVAASAGRLRLRPFLNHMSDEELAAQSSVSGSTALHLLCKHSGRTNSAMMPILHENFALLLERDAGRAMVTTRDHCGTALRELYLGGSAVADNNPFVVGARLPLHVACEAGDPDTIRLLLEKGHADPNAVVELVDSNNGWQPVATVSAAEQEQKAPPPHPITPAAILCACAAPVSCLESLILHGARITGDDEFLVKTAWDSDDHACAEHLAAFIIEYVESGGTMEKKSGGVDGDGDDDEFAATAAVVSREKLHDIARRAQEMLVKKRNAVHTNTK